VSGGDDHDGVYHDTANREKERYNDEARSPDLDRMRDSDRRRPGTRTAGSVDD
jgi:hypothetical protein